jgi:hypothetical protein
VGGIAQRADALVLQHHGPRLPGLDRPHPRTAAQSPYPNSGAETSVWAAPSRFTNCTGWVRFMWTCAGVRPVAVMVTTGSGYAV